MSAEDPSLEKVENALHERVLATLNGKITNVAITDYTYIVAYVDLDSGLTYYAHQKAGPVHAVRGLIDLLGELNEIAEGDWTDVGEVE